MPFRIFKIDKIKVDPTNPKLQYYEILFCSPESYQNVTTKSVQEHLRTVENGVQKVLRSRKYLNSKKRFYFERNKDKRLDMSSQVENHIKQYNFLSKQAISAKYSNAGYMFYETADEGYFRSLESLFSLGGGTLRTAKMNYLLLQMVQTTIMITRQCQM